jgi:ATP-dependent Clp protease ATP-binding subunit ClpX
MKKSINCNFCGKDIKDVEKLVSGDNAYICEKCIEMCYKIIVEGKSND